ncbi:hypothetical protein NTE_03407 [Candidatus Nitrososphaera evergladensis SR1]|uniref:Uncharacterized protein n=1 Tax=Candidatus Nitrososphaera evergladensis SR1 TaxID=1459636 RepID=A0A075MW06_9ARCH|nr:outer membrane family protein [Candidatus Nitrososphaera evergladensis]AIF85435.1 hypothetical protein NTE_03407 [Candidatus Nitrososphaera evergladensis SR1]
MTTELVNVGEVRNQFAKLREAYRKVLPKVDPALLNDFLQREAANSDKDEDGIPYTIEVFTKEGLDTQVARQYILEAHLKYLYKHTFSIKRYQSALRGA